MKNKKKKGNFFFFYFFFKSDSENNLESLNRMQNKQKKMSNKC